MRSFSRDKQEIWFSKLEERQDGIDTVLFYSKPIMKKMAVSTSAGAPNEISAGIVPDYERYITRYKIKGCTCDNFNPNEGDMCWIDVIPQLDTDGNLVMDTDGITPITPPDYVIKKLIDSKKSKVARIGISKIGGSE